MAGAGKVAVLAALVANFVIAILKLGAGVVSGSSAMLAEAAHSFSDVGNQILLLLGIRLSARPASPRYPFGAGKSAYFWPFMVAILLFGVAGGYSVFEGVDKILHPHPIEDIRLALIVLGIAFVVEIVSLVIAVRAAVHEARARGVVTLRQFIEENRDASLLTVLVEDGLALGSLPIAALALVLAKATGDPVWDGIGSLVIGALLMGFALFLAVQVQALLIGRGLSPRDRRRVLAILDEEPGVDRVLALQSMYLGPGVVLLGVEVVLAGAADAPDEATALLSRLEARLVRALPQLRYVYLEPVSGVAHPPPTTGHGA